MFGSKRRKRAERRGGCVARRRPRADREPGASDRRSVESTRPTRRPPASDRRRPRCAGDDRPDDDATDSRPTIRPATIRPVTGRADDGSAHPRPTQAVLGELGGVRQAADDHDRPTTICPMRCTSTTSSSGGVATRCRHAVHRRRRLGRRGRPQGGVDARHRAPPASAAHRGARAPRVGAGCDGSPSPAVVLLVVVAVLAVLGSSLFARRRRST